MYTYSLCYLSCIIRHATKKVAIKKIEQSCVTLEDFRVVVFIKREVNQGET